MKEGSIIPCITNTRTAAAAADMMIMTIYLELGGDANTLIYCWVFNYSGCYRQQIIMYSSVPTLLASRKGIRCIQPIIGPLSPRQSNC